MIVTVTPNPTLDRVVFVRGFRLGAIVRGERETLTPSGKGVDASLVLHALGLPTLAIGLQAGRQGRLAVELLTELGVPHEFVWADGETRHALVLVDLEAGAQSTISVATLRATHWHLAELAAMIERYLPQAWFVVLAGSLPNGWPVDAYRRLIGICRDSGVPTLLDTSGAALAATLAADGGSLPDIVKVNAAELESLFPVDSQPRLPGERAADLRLRSGCDAVVVTLGAAGAIAVTAEGAWRAIPPQVDVVNDAGAGDALAGCLAWARSVGQDWPAALRLGVAAAVAVVTTPGTAACDRASVDRLMPLVRVEPGADSR